MDEVAFQDEVVAVLKKSLQGADVSIPAAASGHHAVKNLKTLSVTLLFILLKATYKQGKQSRYSVTRTC